MQSSVHRERLLGEVISFSSEKKYGFIKDQAGVSYFFYQSEENFKVDLEEGLILKKYYAHVGDTVSFLLRPNFLLDDPPVACGLIRLANFHRLDMIRMGAERRYLVGQVYKFGKEFFIKHSDTGAFVQVVTNSSYKDAEEWLSQKVYRWVQFTLTKQQDEKRVCAHVLDMPLRNAVHKIREKIETGEAVEGKVVHRSNKGITVLLTEYYLNGNISITCALTPEEITYFENVKIGQLVTAFPTSFHVEQGFLLMDFFRPCVDRLSDLSEENQEEID
jgi:hypothetical protein